jgi:hypothetical protein
MEPLAVERDDARGLLPTVLQGVQPSAVMAAASGCPKMPNTPHSLAQPVFFQDEDPAVRFLVSVSSLIRSLIRLFAPS